jgi:hypothetical protein
VACSPEIAARPHGCVMSLYAAGVLRCFTTHVPSHEGTFISADEALHSSRRLYS